MILLGTLLLFSFQKTAFNIFIVYCCFYFCFCILWPVSTATSNVSHKHTVHTTLLFVQSGSGNLSSIGSRDLACLINDLAMCGDYLNLTDRASGGSKLLPTTQRSLGMLKTLTVLGPEEETFVNTSFTLHILLSFFPSLITAKHYFLASWRGKGTCLRTIST